MTGRALPAAWPSRARPIAWFDQAHLLHGARREDRRPVVLYQLHIVPGRLESEA